MQNFFAIIWKWFRWVLLGIILIWLIFFLLNLFFPKFSRYVEDKIIYTSSANASDSTKAKIPLKMRIYQSLFGGSKDRREATSTEATSTDDTNSTSSDSYTNSYSSNASDYRNTLPAQGNYVFPNTGKKHEVAPQFKFDDNSLTKDGDNLLINGGKITGEVSSNYLSHLDFDIYVYDANRQLLYTIPAHGIFDPNSYEYLEIEATNYSAFNLGHYSGDGYIAIWTDRPEDINSILISKIKIED